MKNSLPTPGEFAKLWLLDPETVYLNHGSFGACPAYLLEKQNLYQRQLERQPVRFMIREMEKQFDTVRQKAAAFVNAAPDDLVMVTNATAGVNTILRSLKFSAGDEIIFTNHIYPACKNALEFVAEQAGAKMVQAFFDFPLHDPGVIIDAILGKVTPRTRLVLVDHISSATALVHPVEELVKELDKRGIDTLIDGAHAIGGIPLDLDNIGAAYYTSNCHKWLCTPKGAAILHVRRDKQDGIVPLVISHAGHRSASFAERFFWPGTYDPSAVLCVADAIEYLGQLLPGGWPALMKRNHDLCLQARNLICSTLEIDKPCPDNMLASMATFPLTLKGSFNPPDYKSVDAFQDLLFSDYHIEIPVWYWSEPPKRLTRIAVQLYNSMEQYQYLAVALKEASKSRE